MSGHPTSQASDSELLTREDGDAFAELYRRHARQIAAYLMRATRSAEAAADLTAETFAAALVARRRYRSERAGFFERLERELALAAERQSGRRIAWPSVGRATATAAVAATLLVLVLVPVFVLSGGGDGRPAQERFPDSGGLTLPPVGTVIGKGEGDPPRSEPHTVVATGSAPFAGPWQLEAYRGSGLRDPQTGEQYEPPGLDCLVVFLRSPPPSVLSAGSGGCGVQRRTPGFDRRQVNVQTRDGVKEVLVFGHVPERASAVVITAADGRPGSRGAELWLP